MWRFINERNSKTIMGRYCPRTNKNGEYCLELILNNKNGTFLSRIEEARAQTTSSCETGFADRCQAALRRGNDATGSL